MTINNYYMLESISRTFGAETDPSKSIERHRSERPPRELPVLTAYILRHGETTENKLDPKRGLTEKGEAQTDAAAERLIQELNPDRDIIQILDSGNHRATVTVMRIAEKLKTAGFKFFEPVKVGKGDINDVRQGGMTTAEQPKSRKLKKIEAAALSDDFKKKLANPALHEQLGLPEEVGDKRVAAWYGLAELGQIPEDAESPAQVSARVKAGMEQTQRFIPMLAGQLGPDKRLVTIAGANATAVDTTITDATGIKAVKRGGEIENCEGFKVDFRKDEEPTIAVWGGKIEEVAKK